MRKIKRTVEEIGSKYEWEEYTGDRLKTLYDIKLKNGIIITKCYPNSNTFTDMNDGRQFKERNVAEIRFREDEWWPIPDKYRQK